MNRTDILQDYRILFRSRLCSLIGRKEVLTGKASFGIFGDGVELAQIALARSMQNGDFRAGYYRDQTMEFWLGNLTVAQFFSQLYADIDPAHEPSSSGRQMNCHFASRLLDERGEFKNLLTTKNTSADISPTAGQMNRLLGLAYASKMYRNEKALHDHGKNFSNNGNEIAFGTIGDASTSEGPFFEVMNAAGVLQVPLVMSVWDNGFGISVPRILQTVRDSISKALAGFKSNKKNEGIDIYTVRAWDYPKLCKIYQTAAQKTRTEHKPALIHVTEVTQPQGHSTSGSHERYKSKERLFWEKQYDAQTQFKKYILKQKFATQNDLDLIEQEEKEYVESERSKAWQLMQTPIAQERDEAVQILEIVAHDLKAAHNAEAQYKVIENCIKELKNPILLQRRVIQSTLFKSIDACAAIHNPSVENLNTFYKTSQIKFAKAYSSHLYNEFDSPILNKPIITPLYDSESGEVDGRVVLLKCFEHHLQNNPNFFVLGEDVGKLGDVNLVFEGLNAKFGDLRVTDTGIREASILGQGLGAAIRGLRPLVDIQYLDYFLFALQTASDDLATLFYRTAGGQKAPVIIRTKGHRLEGVWHSGSPMGVLLNSLRGMYICVPRNMTQAAGMYNLLLQCSNPAIVIEVLNGYRLKEIMPKNIDTFTVLLGVPEILRTGKHVTVVTYGACCRIAMEAAVLLEKQGIDIEVIDVQTLLPFDTQQIIKQSIQKTNAVLFFDEDVPGGTTAYMMQQVLETQQAFDYLDTAPVTLTASENRPPYGRDGDYFTKPQVEDVYWKCMKIIKK